MFSDRSLRFRSSRRLLRPPFWEDRFSSLFLLSDHLLSSSDPSWSPVVWRLLEGYWSFSSSFIFDRFQELLVLDPRPFLHRFGDRSSLRPRSFSAFDLFVLGSAEASLALFLHRRRLLPSSYAPMVEMHWGSLDLVSSLLSSSFPCDVWSSLLLALQDGASDVAREHLLRFVGVSSMRIFPERLFSLLSLLSSALASSPDDDELLLFSFFFEDEMVNPFLPGFFFQREHFREGFVPRALPSSPLVVQGIFPKILAVELILHAFLDFAEFVLPCD